MQKIITVSASTCRKDLYKLLHLVEKGYLIKIVHRRLGDFKIRITKDEKGNKLFQLGFWEQKN